MLLNLLETFYKNNFYIFQKANKVIMVFNHLYICLYDMFITYQMIVAHFKSLQIIYDRHLNINCDLQNNAKLYTEHWHRTCYTVFV